jgi:hypothetical protein
LKEGWGGGGGINMRERKRERERETHKKLARSCGNAVRLLGSPAVSAYIMALVCGGADTLHMLRRFAAQLG